MAPDPDGLFCDGDLDAVLRAHHEKVAEKVDSIPEEQFLGTEDETLVQHVASAMEVEPIELHEDRKHMEVEETQIDVRGRLDYFGRDRGRPVLVPGRKVTVCVPYTGEPELWTLHPIQYQMSPPHGHIRQPGRDGVGYLDIVIEAKANASGEAFAKGLEDTLKQIRWYLSEQKQEIEQHNAQLPTRLLQAVEARRQRLKHREGVIKALNIPLRRRNGVPGVQQIPIKRKLVRPLPAVAGKPPEPGIRNEDYEHILSVIRHEGRTFEATPATFAVHDEEELRDIILAHLNGHYQGDATEEAFRRSGKTDIRIEVENRAAFVAECKVWRGPKKLSKAVGQLLSYLTWRDCKAALVVFNKDVAGFTGVQGKVPAVLASHPDHLRQVDCKHAGEWRFVFKSAEDPDRQVTVHVFLFNLYVTP